jgi:hypothetical protein
MTGNIEDQIFELVTPDIQEMFFNAITEAIVYSMGLKMENGYFKKRTISNIINDRICKNVETAVKAKHYSVDQVHLYEEHTSLRLSLANGKIVIRVKKMSPAGVTSNIVTNEVLKFEDQMNLFDMNPRINVNAGYALLHGGIDYEVLLSHPNGRGKIDWKYEIPAAINKTITEIPYQADENKIKTKRTAKAKEGLGKDATRKSQS